MNNLAPIILFTYKRPWHTKNVLDALSGNEEAKNSILYVYCDGIKETTTNSDKEKINKVRDIVKNENRFKEVVITIQEKNKGLAQSIIDGVTEVVNKHGKIIVLEDDLVVSLFFLDYMNNALNYFKEHKNIGTIAGCNFFANGSEFPESFFLPITSSWGWATWADRWQNFRNDNENLLKEVKQQNLSKVFNAYGSYPYEAMMQNQINNKVSSWAISWHAVHVLNKWLCCYPNISLVNHVESTEATHANMNITPPLSHKKIEINTNEISINDKVLHAMKLGFNGKGDYFGKMKKNIPSQNLKTRMKSKVQKGIQYVFAKTYSFLVLRNPYLNVNILQEKLNKSKVEKCLENVVIGKDSKFYEEAEVHNLQNNKNKIVIGDNTHIRGELLVFSYDGKISIGNNSYIGKNTFIRSASNIKIGNGVLISHNCNIIDTNSHEIDYLERVDSFKKMVKEGHPKTKPNVDAKPIIIEDYAWLSYNVSILKGVIIGKGAIIAAGSVVTKDVEEFTLVAGNPARFIKKITV